jgi:archaellum component FlaD/FlaE
MTWMNEKKHSGKDVYSEKEKKKLEKSPGDVKAVTVFCNWLYRVVSW